MGRTDTTAHHQPSRSGRQTGFSLVEILVTLVAFSLGLLGTALLSGRATQLTHGALMRNQAVLHAQDILDRMQANRMDLSSYQYLPGEIVPACDTQAHCDLADWLSGLSALPQGQGYVQIDALASMATVTISWNDERAGGEAATQLTVQSRL